MSRGLGDVYKRQIECKTDLPIIDLFEKIKKIETLLGRKKSIKNAPRTCDIDIIDFNNTCKSIIHKGEKIITPHPRIIKEILL